MARLLLLNGPNLRRREPGHYGRQTLAEIEADLIARAQAAGHELAVFQSNAEHALIERIHNAAVEGVVFILFNPAAFTHGSIALRDALLGVNIPFIEIHLSNVFAREPFRHRSYFSDIAQAVMVGLGPMGYRLGLEAALARLTDATSD